MAGVGLRSRVVIRVPAGREIAVPQWSGPRQRKGCCRRGNARGRLRTAIQGRTAWPPSRWTAIPPGFVQTRQRKVRLVQDVPAFLIGDFRLHRTGRIPDRMAPRDDESQCGRNQHGPGRSIRSRTLQKSCHPRPPGIRVHPLRAFQRPRSSPRRTATGPENGRGFKAGPRCGALRHPSAIGHRARRLQSNRAGSYRPNRQGSLGKNSVHISEKSQDRLRFCGLVHAQRHARLSSCVVAHMYRRDQQSRVHNIG